MDMVGLPLPKHSPIAAHIPPQELTRDSFQSIVISIFAIVILSVLGSLFRKNHHSVMGSEDDPEDGGAVAGAVFGAVAIYGVCGSHASLSNPPTTSPPLTQPRPPPALPCLLLQSSLASPKREEERSHCAFVMPCKTHAYTHTHTARLLFVAEQEPVPAAARTGPDQSQTRKYQIPLIASVSLYDF